MLSARLWFGRESGGVLFLGLVLVLIGCVGAGLVLLEIADELGVNSNRSRDDAHGILGERAGFVGTDDRGVRHRLTGAENTDEKLFGGHSLRSECEREGHGQRETFRNSDDDECD